MQLPRMFFFALLFLLAWSCGSGDEAAETVVEDIVKAAPENATLLFENDSVRVVQFKVPPQGKLPMHHGRDRVVYSLSDYRLRYQAADVAPSDNISRAGEVHWHSRGDHAVTNIGPITAEYVTFARKASNPTPGVTSNLIEVAPEKAEVIFENQDAKVIRVSLEPGDKLPSHIAAGRTVYTLTPAKLKFVSGGVASEAEFAKGDVHWHDGGEHEVENLSAEPVQYVVVELM